MRLSLSRTLAGAAMALAVAAGHADAQYFGRNKVRYERFDFRILDAPHFDIHFYPAESLATVDAARMAERWYARLSGLLGFEFASRPIVFYADHPDFQQSNIYGGMIEQGTGGFTEGARNRVVMPFTGIYAETDHVLGHELVHVFQYAIADSLRSAPGRRAGGLESLPLWLIEGMAEYLSVGRDDPHTAMWLRDAMLRDDIPTIRQLTTDSRFFPYRYGEALWAYIGGRYGDRTVATLYRAALEQGFERAIGKVLGISHDSLSREWHAAIRTAYQPLLEGRSQPGSLATRVTSRERRESGMMEISPALSPDGRHIAFLSTRNLVSIDLFVAEVETGRIVAQLTTPNADPHFGALSYIAASGSWSPDGRRLAFVTLDEGANQVAIFDVERRRVVRRHSVPGAGAIRDAAWGPTGRIAVSAMSGGIGDLWLLDPESGATTRLTDDRYAELHPAWSPDGRRLAFATDRGPHTSFDSLVFGPMRLAVLDMATGAIELLPAIPGAKHIDPQFSPDGASLFFVADREGVSDVYRLALADGSLHQVTRLTTGVSGITAHSSALTVAALSGRMAFSVFEDGGQALYRLDPDATAGTPVGFDAGDRLAGLLPPADALAGSVVDGYLADASTGLADAASFTYDRFRERRLGLEYLGAPTAGVTFGGPRTAVGGSVQAYFSDMMNDRILGAALFGGGTLQDFGGEVAWFDQSRRINWMVGASHVPYIVGGIATVRDTAVTMGGGLVGAQIYEQAIGRLFFDQIATAAHYPLSTTRRIELGVSMNQQRFGVQSDRWLLVGNQVVGRLPSNDASSPSLRYVQASLAHVGDYSTFGFTSPIAGGRHRVEASPMFGQMSLTTLLADYRRYVFLRPVTFAVRGLHYGMYGRDAEGSPWVQPLFVGHGTLVRGYEAGSFSLAECTGGSQGQCPEFERLIGSRIGVASAELRIPLIGPRQLALIPLRFLPVEVAPFVDAGAAWTSDESPRFGGGSGRVPVFSAGVSTRVNLFGAMILETYYAMPFQRESGWRLGFNIAPGW